MYYLHRKHLNLKIFYQTALLTPFGSCWMSDFFSTILCRQNSEQTRDLRKWASRAVWYHQREALFSEGVSFILNRRAEWVHKSGPGFSGPGHEYFITTWQRKRLAAKIPENRLMLVVRPGWPGDLCSETVDDDGPFAKRWVDCLPCLTGWWFI